LEEDRSLWKERFKNKSDAASEVRDWLESRIKELDSEYLKSNESEEGELDYWVQITRQRYAQLSPPARQMANAINAVLETIGEEPPDEGAARP
jgi:hypothetical protein